MTKVQDLQTRYKSEIIPKLKKDLGIKNEMALPKVTKVKINVGMGSYLHAHGKDYESIVDGIAAISGQKPIVTIAKKAISNFKIREEMPVGVAVTLRGKRMYDFLNKLVNIVFPRVRDFRGISKRAFDGKGNYNVGFKEHTVFPEISPDEVTRLHGVQITIVTSANTNEEGALLLQELGFPFKKEVLKGDNKEETK